MSPYIVSIKVIKPTGAVIRTSPNATSPTNIIGGIAYGQVLHRIIAQSDWWVLPQQHYLSMNDAVTVIDDDYEDTTERFNFHPMSQQNPSWANHVLGFSYDPRITIGRYGSWLVVATILANAAQDIWLDPIQMNMQHKQNNGFYAPGLLGGFPTHFRFDKETGGRVRLLHIVRRSDKVCSPELLSALKAHISRGQPAMIEVDPSKAVSQLEGGVAPIMRRNQVNADILESPMHFVLATDFNEVREALTIPSIMPRTFVSAQELGQSIVELKIIDPWDGQTKSLCPTYGPDLASAIVRVIFFEIRREPTRKKGLPDHAVIGQVVESIPFSRYTAVANVAPAETNDAKIGNVHLPAPPLPQLGINALWNSSASMDAFNKGCRFFTCVNDVAMVNALSDLGATVMARWIWTNWTPSHDLYFQHLSGDRAKVIYLGLDANEMGSDSPEKIRKRAAFDVTNARMIRERSRGRARYAAGSFSARHPNYDDPDVCKAIQDGYADAYNNGLLLFNVHSEVSEWQGNESLWDDQTLGYTLRRWEFLFKRCGFDPHIRGIVSDQTGLNTSKGGFVNHGVSGDAFVSFCRRWVEVQARQLVIDPQDDALMIQRHISPSPYVGVWHSPFIGGTLFQLGNQGHQDWWAKFNIDAYLNDLGRYFWK
ncbi:MAG: hypothetical protein WCL57_18795 [Chloroflexota bacterium]|jgi:hypothetical protein